MGTAATEDLRAGLGEAIGNGDRAEATRLATEAIGTGMLSIPELYHILSDILVGIGDRWRAGTVAVWQEHTASAIIRGIVEVLYPTVRNVRSHDNGRTVVLACPEDESHDIGLRMLADRFELAGWRVCYLGADTPAGEIASAARAVGAEVVVLSASTHFHRMRLRNTLEALAIDIPDIRVLLGGSALCGDGADQDVDHRFDPSEFFADTDGLVPTCREED